MRRLIISSERLGNEDNAPCPRALQPGRGSNRGPPVWKSEALTARPQQLLNDNQGNLPFAKCASTFHFKVVNEQQVLNVINNLKDKKACGPDGIPAILWE